MSIAGTWPKGRNWTRMASNGVEWEAVLCMCGEIFVGQKGEAWGVFDQHATTMCDPDGWHGVFRGLTEAQVRAEAERAKS